MNKVSKLLTPLALVVSVSAQADVLGASVEATYWYAGLNGDASINNQSVDMEDNLNFEEDGFFELSASFEHFIPLLPNIRLKYTDLDQTEGGELSGTGFDGVSAGPVETNLDLSNVGMVLYYELLDNWVSLDFGVDLRQFDGQLDVSNDSDEVSNTEIDEFVPLAYLSASFDLPLTDLSAGAEVSAISYSGNSLYDAKVRLRQGFSLAFIELGYRQMAIKFDDIKNTDIDIDLSGLYLSTGLDF